MNNPVCNKCDKNEYVIRCGLNASSGTQRYRCQGCAVYFTPQPKPHGYDQGLREQAVKLYLEGMSYRAVARVLGIHNQSVINWVKAVHDKLPDKVGSGEKTDYIEVDELFSFVGKKKPKCT